MHAITSQPEKFKAALMTDGVIFSFTQAVLGVDSLAGIMDEAKSVIGAIPYEEGLQIWLKKAPTFKLETITAPLRITATGVASAMLMWEPYAGLRVLNKPAEFVLLKTSEHVLRTPAARIASQEGAVDWFRYWLKDEQDSDPTKNEQYTRWEALSKLSSKPALH
jgi:hypothetical protein